MYKLPGNVSLITNLVMGTIILSLAFAFAFTDMLTDPKGKIVLEGASRIVLAIIFFLYAGFRFMRAWQVYNTGRREEQRKRWEKTNTRHRRH